MNYTELKAAIANMGKGTIHTLVYARDMKTRKGVTDKVTKTTTMQIRLGVRYDNIKAVKEARADGSLPSENAGLPDWQAWIDDNFIFNKKSGAVMLRVAYANGNKTETEYRRNNVVVMKSEIEPLCLKSETAPRDSAPTVFNISVDKIISIK